MKLPLASIVVTSLVVGSAGERQAWLFDDFESAERVAAHELGWIPLGDDLMGGGSSVVLESLAGGRNGSGRVLRLRGSIGPGPRAFTGAWAPLDGRGRPVDVGAFGALRFFARGEGTYQAGIRSGMQNFMGSFTVGPEWKPFEIPFERFAAAIPGSADARFNPQQAHWLGITTSPGASGAFQLELDDLELVARGAGEPPKPVAGPGPARTIRVKLAPAPVRATWRDLGKDAAGDGKLPSLPDAVSLAVADDGGERVWFRVGLRDAPPPSWLGVNLALDVDGDAASGTPWWGVNTGFRFDRLVSVWLFKSAGGTYVGTAGVAGAGSVADGEFMADGQDVQFAIDRESRAFLVGVPRAALDGGGGRTRLLAAVGSALGHNDDIPDTGAIELPRR